MVIAIMRTIKRAKGDSPAKPPLGEVTKNTGLGLNRNHRPIRGITIIPQRIDRRPDCLLTVASPKKDPANILGKMANPIAIIRVRFLFLSANGSHPENIG